MNWPRFRVTTPGLIDVLGVWEVEVAQAAFAASESPSEEIWRVDLPPIATPALDDRAAALRAALRDITAADSRLTAFVVHPSDGRELAFFREAGPGPEQELAGWVQFARGAVSFGWRDILTGGWWQDSVRGVRDFIAQLTRSLASAARVETSVGGVRVGVTVVGWCGRTVTVWQTGADRTAAEAHSRAVALALATRRAWLRLATTVVSGAAGLAVRIAVPGGGILAIPAVWRFVRRVMADIRQVGGAGG